MKSEVRADCILEEYFLNMSLYPNQLPFCSYENEPSETKGRVTGRRFFFFFFLLGGKEPSQGRGWHGEYVVTQLEKQSSGPAVSEVST